ncbi:hypothetical protein QTP88_003206 [Uroleucon formosanum]
MEEKRRRFEDIDGEPIIRDLESLLFYVTRFEDGDFAYIFQPDDNSKSELFETIQDDVVVLPTAQEAEEDRSDEASYVTSARGLEVRNSFGDLIGWLDTGVTPEICAAPRRRTARIVSAVWRGTQTSAAPGSRKRNVSEYGEALVHGGAIGCGRRDTPVL